MHEITVALGDGIGPEIMKATLHVLKEAGAELKIHEVEIGEKVYQRGVVTGIEPKTWETIKRTEAFLKAPITTPQGGGFKSLNVTVRTTLGLYANIRPCVSYSPYIQTKNPKMDLVIVRENEEDLYAGIEYRQTPDVMVSHKIITRQGSEKIIRYGFEYARQHGRKKVSCFTKDNIMKFSDGLFHKIFEEIAKEYPEIENEHWIVDIGAAKLADKPENFEVIILPNLYGDILSDVAAEVSGSVGLAPSANIGNLGAMFEAIHGSAPRRAGQNVANPSGLLLASVMMLGYLGEAKLATQIHEAWLYTIEAGIHTYDIYKEKNSKQLVGTQEFAQAVVNNLGKKPSHLKCPIYQSTSKIVPIVQEHQTKIERKLVGVDIFVYSKEKAAEMEKKITGIRFDPFKLKMITNRGVRIWPEGHPETFCIEQWRCRFIGKEPVRPQEIIALLDHIVKAGYDVFKTENLYMFDGAAGYTSAEG
ncbi:MAG TPA: NADP-dependent isocitrate dehydrogenase [Rhabdochlamydiaceae bacterium]|jgi:isocitrate dehydrogenase|nr:NADP-dependent isocitrate dehydrogenase [Rhabdochlamydiaceae bacterium]